MSLFFLKLNKFLIKYQAVVDYKYLPSAKQYLKMIGVISTTASRLPEKSFDNLEIDATLLAQNGRVGREYYYFSSYRWRDTITVFGSIVTNKRYGFAYTDGTGYDIRNLYFDNNLLYYPPPFFPTGTVYELDLWEDL